MLSLKEKEANETSLEYRFVEAYKNLIVLQNKKDYTQLLAKSKLEFEKE
jgi:hypothetical protein